MCVEMGHFPVQLLIRTLLVAVESFSLLSGFNVSFKAECVVWLLCFIHVCVVFIATGPTGTETVLMCLLVHFMFTPVSTTLVVLLTNSIYTSLFF